jgi:inhibitor of cysteine peptidase
MVSLKNIILIFSSLVLGGVSIVLLRDYLWNRRLKNYQAKYQLKVDRPIINRRFERLMMAGSTALLMLLAVIVPARTYFMGERQLVNAKPVLNKIMLNNLMAESNSKRFGLFGEFMPAITSSEAAASDASMRQNDVIGTNVQVSGVDEADIIKTDGNTIYFATRGYNRIRIIDVLDNKFVNVKPDLNLENLYTDSLYLTSDYLIVIGYTFEASPYLGCAEGMACIGFGRMFMPSTGSVKVFNRTDLTLAYSLETDSMFFDHRLIEDKLFLVSHKYLFNDVEPRPSFKTNVAGVKAETLLDYENIYYFDNIPGYELSVLTGIDLSTFNYQSQAFVGGVSYLYVSLDSVYTAYNFYQETLMGGEWSQKVQIVKYDINMSNASLDYVGQIQLDGHVYNQFWMDEFNNNFRVVTTSSQWTNNGAITKNQLFIIQDNLVNDQLQIVGSITENLGKPGEIVKAVRFNGNLGQVVTFEQVDPLYTIDLSNPANPVITGKIEEPGYSTYLHNWTDTRLIGLGLDVVEGQVMGLKISAYDTALEAPLMTYYLAEKSDDGFFTYSYSEALYNHKAMMISPEKGIFAFPVSKYAYKEEVAADGGRVYSFKYQSEYLVFMIDFSKPFDQIIAKPIRINHDMNEYNTNIERGVYINNVIYTLSMGQMVSYDLGLNQVLEDIKLALILES